MNAEKIREALRRPCDKVRLMADKSPVGVRREGGDNDNGMLLGASIITRGEALGHGFWIDSTFLTQIAQAINSAENGIVSRFTHPALSGDGLDSRIGRVKNARHSGDGNRVLADLHFYRAASNTPRGDLREYILSLAEEDPSSFGFSIVFEHDTDAEAEFAAAHMADGVFTSPDPLNTDNLPHARLKKLWKVDLVDEPAANPDGLFHRHHEFAAELFGLADYVLGLGDERPALSVLDVDPDRMRHFVLRYLRAKGLELVSLEQMKSVIEKQRLLAAAAEKSRVCGEISELFSLYGATGLKKYLDGMSVDQVKEEMHKLTLTLLQGGEVEPLGEQPLSPDLPADSSNGAEDLFGLERYRHWLSKQPKPY